MKRLLGGILLAVAILIMVTSGLCSLSFIVIGLFSGNTADALSMLLYALVIGGVPFVVGLGLFYLGRAVLQSARNDER